MHHALDELERTRAECQFGAVRRAKQIGDERKRRARHVVEAQRRATRRDDAPMNLGRLERGINRRGNLDDVAVAPQPVEKRSKVAEHYLGHTQ